MFWYFYSTSLYKIVMVMYWHYKFLKVIYWYWYCIFGNVISNVIQYFLKVMFKALWLVGSCLQLSTWPQRRGWTWGWARQPRRRFSAPCSCLEGGSTGAYTVPWSHCCTLHFPKCFRDIFFAFFLPFLGTAAPPLREATPTRCAWMLILKKKEKHILCCSVFHKLNQTNCSSCHFSTVRLLWPGHRDLELSGGLGGTEQHQVPLFTHG